MTDDPEYELKPHAAAYHRARADLDMARHLLYRSIRDHRAAGMTLDRIADVTWLSKSRVRQIIQLGDES